MSDQSYSPPSTSSTYSFASSTPSSASSTHSSASSTHSSASSTHSSASSTHSSLSFPHLSSSFPRRRESSPNCSNSITSDTTDKFSQADNAMMQLALEQARAAYQHQEVPIGAVLVDAEGHILAKAYNQTLQLNDPTAHAEILALRQGAQQISNHRLLNTTLYVTLEPCAMCAGALVQARVTRLVYAASDTKGGAVESVFNITQHRQLNHQIQTCSGLYQDESVTLLQDFFQARR